MKKNEGDAVAAGTGRSTGVANNERCKVYLACDDLKIDCHESGVYCE